jgi:carboxymethylenebutenolidase
MRAPILALFGGADGGIPAEDNAKFEGALTDHKVPHHLVTYAGAPHSFFDRSFADFKVACDDAWRRMLGFMFTADPKAVK